MGHKFIKGDKVEVIDSLMGAFEIGQCLTVERISPMYNHILRCVTDDGSRRSVPISCVKLIKAAHPMSFILAEIREQLCQQTLK